MSRADTRPEAPHQPDERLRRTRPRNRNRATMIILVSVGIAAVLLIGGTFLLAPEKVYNPGESYGTERPAHIPPPENARE